MGPVRYTILLLVCLLAMGGGPPAVVARAPATAESSLAAPAPAAPLPQRTRLTMGLIPVIPSATVFVPFEKGYFAAENIDFQWEVVQVTSEAIAHVASDNLDLAPHR
jgi:ABC-type nitrate/sulfonate/bicarbonate transport system substrate-binding protein